MALWDSFYRVHAVFFENRIYERACQPFLAVTIEICYFPAMRQVNKNIMHQLLYCLAILFIACWSSPGFAATEISNVRYWAAPDHTRVVFDLSNQTDYQFKISDNILTLEFSDARLKNSLPSGMIVDKPGIDKIIFNTVADHQCKIEIVLNRYLKAEVFKLKKFMDKPDRIVVDIIVQQAVKEEIVPERKIPSVKKRVIVIDPGHGGEDPGAVGKNGTYEKNVVLAISREIKKSIHKMPGYRAILTRDGDYYVSFSKRLSIARQAGASLFISVHADAARNRQAKCSSVYCLSTGAASNEAAKLLANNENLSDIIGGVPNGEGNNQSDEIILNMFQTNTINLSKTFAVDLLDQIGRVHCLKYPVFHEAPFRVLKLLDAPAVLLETAFISHAREERLLKTVSFRKTIASAVATSVANYFSASSPVVASARDAGKKEDRVAPVLKKATDDKRRPVKTMTYRVKRGDTLNAIAFRYETTLTTLLNLNQMKINDPLYVGRKILIPVAEVETIGQRPLKRYTVKKGDTLFSLAKSSSMTIDELRRINNMTDADVLWLGQKIMLPQ
jgi:N-acetylmuramoyl-L-alanine amidase